MKISIIGAGNVGGLTAMRLLQEIPAEIILIDKIPGLAQAKAWDLGDTRGILKYDYHIQGTEDIKEIKESDIIIITAGLTRKPGMTREELLRQNSEILKDISFNIKNLAKEAIIIVVTNPLDLMTYLVLKLVGFHPAKVLGMGVSLDAARFHNLISQELNILPEDIETMVIGSHGEGMLPLPRFTKIKGIALDEFLSNEKIEELVNKTVSRGSSIVSLLGNGSAYFAPSLAIATLVKVIIKDEKRIIGVCTYLKGEYGVKDVCIGVPCRIGRQGIENLIELDLNKEEKEAFLSCASSLKQQYNSIAI